ncbi:sugar MFS transporter [Bacteroidota bacterium]
MVKSENSGVSFTKAYPIFLAFLCMGFGDVVGPLVGLAKDTFSISNTMAQLLPFMGFIMFGILSIPMGVLQDKKGKKFILSLGLMIALVGLIIPIINGMYGPVVDMKADSQSKFYILLAAILLLGAGATIVQVAGNPIMRDVSQEGRYSSNLSLGQSIKALGSSLGFLLPPAVGILFNMDWTILFPLYAILILITLIWTNSITIVEKKEIHSSTASLSSSFKLLKNSYVLIMVMGIFLYVGAEISMSSQVPILVFGIEDFGLWLSWALFFLPILVGRFTGALVLRKIEAKSFLTVTIIISIVGMILIFSKMQLLVYAGIVLSGLGFANIFPLIFSITIDKMPEHTNELSGLMIAAIAGGAIIPLAAGAVADITQQVIYSFLVPLICMLYLFVVAVINRKFI